MKDEKKILDIGCGMFKANNAIGIDFNPDTHADVVHDLESFPYPFEGDFFDEVHCNHVLEHLHDLMGVMKEIHRIGKPGCKVKVAMPYWSSHRAFVDPTHVRYFTENTFEYFTDKSSMNYYSKTRFKVLKKEYEASKRVPAVLLKNNLSLSFLKMFNNTIANISFTLEVVKECSQTMVKRDWPKVSVVLLNWCNFYDSKQCIESLQMATYPSLEIVFVDNASPDGSGNRINEKFGSNIQYIQSGGNLGFSGGCNVGIKHALKNGSDYVLLLNNDTIVKKDFLEHLVEELELRSGCGIAGGKGYFYSDPSILHMAGGEIDWLKATYKRYGAGERDVGQYDKIREVDMISAYFMLVKREVFEKVGMLNEDYFGGLEECDFVLSAKKLGYNSLFVPKAACWHKIGRSFTPFQLKWIYNTYRNKLLFMSRFLSPAKFKIWRIALYFYGVNLAPAVISLRSRSYGNKVSYSDIREVLKQAFAAYEKKPKVCLEDIEKIAKEYL